MDRSGVRFVFVFLLGLLAVAPLRAQQQASANDQGLTADELSVHAKTLYTQGKYAEAAALYRQFITNFGQSKESQPAIREMRFPLAMALLQMRKFTDAQIAIKEALANAPPIDEQQKQELMFWKGVCEMEDKDYEAARKSFDQFIAVFPPGADRNPNYIAQFPAMQKVPEAKLLIGTSYILDDKFKEAAAYEAKIKPTLIPQNRGRATVLELYALLQADDTEGAMKLVMEEYPHMTDIPQLVTFQTLTLQLGSQFLEKKQYRKAIICLQRIWSSDRLLKHQEDRLADMQSKLQAAEAVPRSDPYTKFLLSQMISKVKREIESFKKIANFDSSLRLRLATAYQAMQRYRESALIMEAMLADMPPDKVVESATSNLVQCWMAIERWPKAIESADIFVAKFPKSANVPLILYLKGTAQQRNFQYNDAVVTFDRITKEYPQAEYASRAQFMKGFSLLQAERNKEGIAAFDEFLRKYPQHELADPAGYWRAMGFSLDKQFAKAREAYDQYLAKNKDGQYRTSAVYGKAYCAQQMEDYKTSIVELRNFLRNYPNAEERSEARMMLGDALMDQGQMEEGIAVIKGIPKEDTKFYEEGVFKTAKAYKLMEEPAKYLKLMLDFKAGSPRSPRVAEAIYNIGNLYRQEGDPEKARDIYWGAINEYGDDPSIRSVDDLFPALAKLYKEDAVQYESKLATLASEAQASSKKTLAMRALWAQALTLRKTDPNRSRELMLQASLSADVQTTSPLLLADFADALIASGKEAEGAQMYRDLVKWNPRALQKDGALATLGLIELKNGHEKDALAYFDRFQRETLGSFVFGQVLLTKGQLLKKQGHPDEAREAFEAVLANQTSSGKEKAQALYEIGEIYMAQNKPQLAVPYFQRIYVMHARWRDWVAKAYLRSGEAFEALKDNQAARRSYQELTEKEDLSTTEETLKARTRLNALGGPLPTPTPAQG